MIVGILRRFLETQGLIVAQTPVKYHQLSLVEKKTLICKKLKVDYATKMVNIQTRTILENEIYKILNDFEIQTDNLISARRINYSIVEID